MFKRTCAACLALIALLLSWGCQPTAEAPPAKEPAEQAAEVEDSVWEKAEVPISGGTDYRLDKLAFNCEWALKEGIGEEEKLNAALKKFRVDWLTGRRDKALKDAGEALGLSGPLDPYVQWEVLNAFKDGEGVTVALDYRLGDNAAPDLMPEPNPKQRFFALLHIPSDPELKPRVKKSFTFLEPFEDAAEKKTEPRILDFKGNPFVLYYDEGCGIWMSEQGAVRIALPNVLPSIAEFQADPLTPNSILVLSGLENPIVVHLTEDSSGRPLLTRGQTLMNIDHPMSFAVNLLRAARFNAAGLLGIQPPYESIERPSVPDDISNWHPAIRIVMGWDNPVIIAGEGSLFIPDRDNKRWRDLNFYPPETDNEVGYLGFATDWEVIMIPVSGKARDIEIFRAKVEVTESLPN